MINTIKKKVRLIIKICPKCKEEHEKKGVYCSRTCANSRKFTEESRKKKSLANRKYWDSLTEEQRNIKREILSKSSYFQSENYLESLMTQDWDIIGIQGKRLRVILEQDGHCNKCDITKWNGEIITLEYEHKDGNNENNTRNNVEALCPNCHSQTPTWRGRKNGANSKQAIVEKYLTLQNTKGKTMKHFVSASCEGEHCVLCNEPATHKIGEEIPHDDPYPYRHEYTAYVCCGCFHDLFGDAAMCYNDA